MIKLKIGDNYLLTNLKEKNKKDCIAYMMGCFSKHGQTAMGFDYSTNNDLTEYIKTIRAERITKIYILFEDLTEGGSISMLKTVLKNFSDVFKYELPQVIVHYIDMSKKKNSREFKLAIQVYETLELDPSNLLSRLNLLDDYKKFAKRFKAIPEEIRVIDENIKKMSKEKTVSKNTCTLNSLKYLDLINTAELQGTDLILTIKPLIINPSEDFGKCFSKDSFKRNPYLVKATAELYKGNHFKMVPTKIIIHSNFTPEFYETLDHSFDDMFARHNWSNVGYPHFGMNHFCGGELNDVIAHTTEHGLEYFFICLKQYLTTANMRDYAGRKVWWYPIYDKDDNLVYCAGLEIFRDDMLRKSIPAEDKEFLRTASYQDILDWKRRHDVTFGQVNLPQNADYTDSYSGKTDAFLDYCKEYLPELYKELEKGAE